MKADLQPVLGLAIASTDLEAAMGAALPIAAEPAVAVVVEGAIVTGWKACDIDVPTPVSFDFWSHLSRTPILNNPAGSPIARSVLAYHHVQQAVNEAERRLGQSPTSAVLAVPPSILDDPERLGLLLSMCASLGLTLRGILPLPLALAAACPAPIEEGQWRVLDLDADQWTLNSVDVSGGTLRLLDGARSTREAAFAQVLDRSVDSLAARFLAETAFDVRHSAEAEQLFRLKVRRFLAEGDARGERELSMGAQRARSISVSRSAARQTSGDLPARLIAALGLDLRTDHRPLLLSPRAQFLPGLTQAIEELEHLSVWHLPIGAAALGATQAGAAWPESPSIEATPVFRTLSGHGRSTTGLFGFDATSPEGSAPEEPSPTHVVWKGCVYPLGHGALPIHLPVAMGQLTPADRVHLNGKPTTGPCRLLPGDRVQLGGHDFLLVQMVQEE